MVTLVFKERQGKHLCSFTCTNINCLSQQEKHSFVKGVTSIVSCNNLRPDGYNTTSEAQMTLSPGRSTLLMVFHANGMLLGKVLLIQVLL